jgi:hypothetical protein
MTETDALTAWYMAMILLSFATLVYLFRNRL